MTKTIERFKRNNKDLEYFFTFIKTSDNISILWEMKSEIRQAIREWLMSMISDSVTSDICSSACSELFENCIKFCSENDKSTILINVSDDSIIMETFNKTEEKQRLNFFKYFDSVTEGSKDIIELYIENLRQSVFMDSAKLGLIKILMETKGKLYLLDRPEKNLVHIKLEIKYKNNII